MANRMGEHENANEKVDCMLEGGGRMGPLELVAREGRHAFVKFAGGPAFPLPARAVVPTRKRRTPSGERMLDSAAR